MKKHGQGFDSLKTKKPLIKRIKKESSFHLMIWLGVIFVIIFNYIPMGGLIIAFKDFNLRDGIWSSPWAGMSNFQNLFSDYFMGTAIFNTAGIALLSIFLSLPIVVFFAIMLNELRNRFFKRVVQTISYLPHFISWVIMAVILQALLSPRDGIVNSVLMSVGFIEKPIFFLGDASKYWGTVVFSSIWKELGWNAIVYLAVISGIDPQLYEAAHIDGAGHLQRIRYITLPSLTGIIAIMLILRMGRMPETGFQQAFFLSNDLNYERSNVLTYYVYTIGLRRGDFSYSTAIGLVTASVSAFLMLTTNWVSKKISGRGLF